MVFLNLHLNSTNHLLTLIRTNNTTYKQMIFKRAFLSTNALSKKIYYLEIRDLYINETFSNINDKQLVPIYEGINENINLILTPENHIPQKIEYNIYDESGQLTNDIVTINVLIELL